MKKRFVFTKESSFTHVKDKMHQSVTEHIVQDDQTQKLYHHVVSYGSWFVIKDESVFMSHLLKELGIEELGVSYVADECQFDLPWYPFHEPKTKSVVELPDGVKLEDISFEVLHSRDEKPEGKTFFTKEYDIACTDGKTYKYSGEKLLKPMFACCPHTLFYVYKEKASTPFKSALAGFGFGKVRDMEELLYKTDACKYEEIKGLLEAFGKFDLKPMMLAFDAETKRKHQGFYRQLLERQQLVKEYFATHFSYTEDQGDM